jgi:hypothetical protein
MSLLSHLIQDVADAPHATARQSPRPDISGYRASDGVSLAFHLRRLDLAKLLPIQVDLLESPEDTEAKDAAVATTNVHLL